MEPLKGLIVIDFGQYIAGPLTARFLMQYGAEVIHVDPPGGEMYASDGNIALNHGKKCIRLNLKDEIDRQKAIDLVKEADILIENFRPKVMDRLGLSADEMCRLNPRLIYCSIPGFSREDERADIQGWEGIVEAEAGVYRTDKYDMNHEPVFNALPLASHFAAIGMAHSIMAALIVRERTGRGQRIEYPLYDACFELMQYMSQKPDMATLRGLKKDNEKRVSTSALYLQGVPCKDGRYLRITHPSRSMDRFRKYILNGAEDTWENFVKLRDEKIAERTASEWEDFFQNELKVAITRINTSEEWLHDDYALKTGTIEAADNMEKGKVVFAGKPLVLKERNIGTVRKSEKRNNDPLSGYRILDLCQVLAGPSAGRLLAEYGADVIKINNPHPNGDSDGIVMLHEVINNGKLTTLLDLKDEKDRKTVDELIREADIIHSNFTIETRKRLKLTDEDIRKINPDIIVSYLNVNTEGDPYGNYRGHEELGEALTGMEYRFGGSYVGERLPIAVCDMYTGNTGTFGILMAVYAREKYGIAMEVQSSLSRSGTMMQLPYMISYEGKIWDEPSGLKAKGFSKYDRIYETKDSWIYLVDPERYLSGIPEEQLEEEFRKKESDSLIKELNSKNITAVRCRSFYNDALDEEYAAKHDLVFSLTRKDLGEIKVSHGGKRLSETPVRHPYTVNEVGEDTEKVRETGWKAFEDI